MSSGTTPGRKTRLKLNTPVTIQQQGLWFQDLSMAAISDSTASTNGAGTMPSTPPNGNFQVQFFNEMGWKIQSYLYNLSFAHETTTVNGQTFPGTWANDGSGSGLLGAYSYQYPDWIMGMGATSGATGPNDQFFSKSIKAGASTAIANTADQTAYPTITASGLDAALVSMDRVFTGNVNHQPDQDIWLRIRIPEGSPLRSHQAVGVLYLCGMPTYLTSDSTPGKGQYGLVFWGDGWASMLEWNGILWKFRQKLLWAHADALASGKLQKIHIHQDAFLDSDGNWHGSVIQLEMETVYNNIFTAVSTNISVINPNYNTYHVNQASPVQPTLQPVRIDFRRDISVRGDVKTSLFYTQGYIKTKVQITPFEPKDPTSSTGSTAPVYVTAYGTIPKANQGGGAVVFIDMYEAGSGLALTKISTVYNETACTAQFKIPRTPSSTETNFFAIITLYSTTDQLKTPIISRVAFQRVPIVKTSTPTPVTVPTVSSLSLAGPDRDPTQETASFILPDVYGQLDPYLDVQGGQTYCLDTYGFNPANPTQWTRLQQGRLVSSKRVTRGNARSTYPNYGVYHCVGVGEWSTLCRRKTYFYYNFAQSNDSSGKPWKVTDAIKVMFSAAGYSPTQISVPDLPIRFFAPQNTGGTVIVESYTPIGPVIAQWARDYLGAFIRWDPNYTNGGGPSDELGCWRVIVPPSPVGLNAEGQPGYNYLCNFKTDPLKGSLFYQTINAYNPNGQSMLQTFARKKSFSTSVIPPAYNCILVAGVGAASGGTLTGGGGVPVQLVGRFLNYYAADFGQNHTDDGHPLPDPTHPDYEDGVPHMGYYSDPSLQTTEAVSFVTRRIFDLCCHAQKFAILEAPLVLVQPYGDPNWIRPRPLAFGDPVLLDGEPYFIWTAPSGKWWEGKGQQQQAVYELRSVPALTAEYTYTGTDLQFYALGGKVA